MLFPYANSEAVFVHGQAEHLILAHNYIGVVSLATIVGTLAGYEHSGARDPGLSLTKSDRMCTNHAAGVVGFVFQSIWLAGLVLCPSYPDVTYTYP